MARPIRSQNQTTLARWPSALRVKADILHVEVEPETPTGRDERAEPAALEKQRCCADTTRCED